MVFFLNNLKKLINLNLVLLKAQAKLSQAELKALAQIINASKNKTVGLLIPIIIWAYFY